jgi:PAS domain S-box-containing protein
LRQKYHAVCQAEPKQLAIGKEFHRTDRALKTLLTCNKTLLSSTDENELLAGICQNSLTVGGYKMAWIGFAQQDEQKTVLPVAQAGYEDGYLGTVNITWADAERGQGPTGTAIRTGKPSILNNILTEPRFAPWRAEAVKRGYVSVIGLPFSVDGHMSGVLTIYAPKPDAFGEHEVDLLIELVNNLSFGITSLRTRAAKKKAEDALRTSEERFSSIANTTTDAVMMTDAQGTIMYWNPAAEHIFGYTADEILGKDAQIIRPERHRATENRNRNLFLTTGSSAYVGKTVEGIALKKDGTEFFIEVSTSHWQQNGQVFFSGIIRDITDRKRTEIELGSYSKSLEEQVKARTAELTEAIVNLKQEMVQHKLTEIALRVSEMNFRTLVELSPDGIGIEQKGTVVFVNSAGAKLLGAESPDQIIGKPLM